MRIVSLCPSNTELLAYLGLIDQLVGVDDYSDWPEGVNHLPRVGPDLSINMDKVAELKPDLVLASLSVPGMEKNIERLNEMKLPYITLNPNSLAEIGESLLTVGEAVGCQEHARNVNNSFQKTINEYKEKAVKINAKQKLYWEWWPKPIYTPGGGNWLTEISELAGGMNVFSDYTEANVKTDWEEVVARKPDVICMIWVGVKTEKMKVESVTGRVDSDQVPAVQGNEILMLEEHLFCRPSPRLIEGLQKLASILHPSVFPEYTMTDSLL